MLSRLQHDLSDDLESLRADDLHFDVDMQNVVSGSGHLFAYLHNSGDESRKIVVKVQTPDFQPHESSFTLTLESSSALEGIDAHLPTRSNTTDDVHDVLARMMQHGEMIWQTLLPQHDGESTVTVRLEDTEGNLLGGKVLAVQVRPKLQERIRLRGGMPLWGPESLQRYIALYLGLHPWQPCRMDPLLQSFYSNGKGGSAVHVRIGGGE